MRQQTEQKNLTAFLMNGGDGRQSYYAAVALANCGGKLNDEATLPDTWQTLIEVRRSIFRHEFRQAELQLSKLTPSDSWEMAEKDFLVAQCRHRLGDHEEARHYWLNAARNYELADEHYRSLRARMNAAIVVADLSSCLFGEVFALEQIARHAGHHDLVANAKRTTALEQLTGNQFVDAHLNAKEACEAYLLAGYRDDHSVACLIGAIALWLQGEKDKASALSLSASIKDGKTIVYWEVFQSLVSDRTPKPPKGHPLASVKWARTAAKSSSVPVKIQQCLQVGPQTRDELIFKIWGDNALDKSYCDRLYTAMNYLRRKLNVPVQFDGERYFIEKN